MNSQRSSHRLRHFVAATGLLLYGTLVGIITLTPRPVDQGFEHNITQLLAMLHRRGIPEWFGYTELEWSMNIVMFIPLGLFITLALPNAHQWVAIFLLPLISIGIEASQALFLPARFATVADVVANSLGGWIGLVLAVLIRAAVHQRDRTLTRVA